MQNPVFDKTNDFTYAKSLEQAMSTLSGEDKVRYIEVHLPLVSLEIQTEWKRKLCREVDKDILKLVPKGFEAQRDGKMSFEIHKDKKPTQTQKLFDLLDKRQYNTDEGEGHAFRNEYSRCVEYVLLARNTPSPIDKYISLVKALIEPMIGEWPKQVSWMNVDDMPIIATWVNSQMGRIKTGNYDKKDLTSFLNSAIDQAINYKKNNLFQKQPIFNKPMKLHPVVDLKQHEDAAGLEVCAFISSTTVYLLSGLIR